MKLVLGAATKRFSEQLDDQGIKYKAEPMVQCQRDADSLVRLFCRQILTETEYDKAAKRLIKRIQEEAIKK